MKNLRENERGKNCGDFGSSFIKIEKKLWPGDHIQCGDFLNNMTTSTFYDATLYLNTVTYV